MKAMTKRDMRKVMTVINKLERLQDRARDMFVRDQLKQSLDMLRSVSLELAKPESKEEKRDDEIAF